MSMIDVSLSSLAAADTVENVLIYVADSMRYDSLPDRVRERGVTARAIAPSTCSHSSFPSLVAGTYPATHELWRETERLPAKPELLREKDGTTAGFDIETQYIEYDFKPPLRWIHVGEESKLDDMKPPFVHVTFDIGAHSPYGFHNGVYERRKDFFRDYPEQSVLRERYRSDCLDSADRFLALLDRLAERDLLERTLVVFAADHGELLGETENGGRFGHLHPICPDLVTVPLVFMGAGLPAGESYPGVLSGLDVAPTALGALGRSVPADVEGRDVWNGSPDPDRRVRADVWAHRALSVFGRALSADAYAATSVWDADGGIVLHRKSALERAAYVCPNNYLGRPSAAVRANWTPQKQARFFHIYFSPRVVYGRPNFDTDDATDLAPARLTKRTYDPGRIEHADHTVAPSDL
jgi:hypothetical protein